MDFDFNHHLEKFSNNLFFEKKSYHNLASDVASFSSVLKTLTSSKKIGLQLTSPYLTMVAMLACLINKKLNIILSARETETMLDKFKEQIHFDFILQDFHFDNLPHQDNISFPKIQFNTPALVLFSSGTTSHPKGVALSFNNLYYSALGFSQFFNQGPLDISLLNLPHHHVGGMMILWRAFFSGSRVVTDLISPIDFISLVPLQLKRMLDNKEKLALLKNIRVILIGGAKLTSSLHQEAKAHGLNLYETYGMTETTSLVMINGEVLPYRKVKLDKAGFFHIKGQTLGMGYFIQQSFFPLGQKWFKTNDIGEVTIDGLFKFKERADLIFISGGENINPLLIEEITKIHPLISDAYLLPVPDAKWGEMGVLLYEATPQALSSNNDNFNDQLKKHFKLSLHPHLIPKFFFSTSFKFDRLVKPKRNDLKQLAYQLYIKFLFSFDLIEHQNSHAPLLVLFHGFMGDKKDLLEVTSHLRANYSILSIDLPGHGQTKIEHFYSLDDILQKLAHFISFFSAAPTYYGYSMGGRVALLLALQYFSPVQLILESSGLGLNNNQEKKQRLSADQELFAKIEQHQIIDFLQIWYANPMFKTYSTLSICKKDCDKKSLHDFHQWQQSLNFLSTGAFPTQANILKKIKTAPFPLTYIYGEEDTKYKKMAIKLSSNLLSNLKIIEIPSAGHNPHKTHVREMTDILTFILK